MVISIVKNHYHIFVILGLYHTQSGLSGGEMFYSDRNPPSNGIKNGDKGHVKYLKE